MPKIVGGEADAALPQILYPNETIDEDGVAVPESAAPEYKFRVYCRSLANAKLRHPKKVRRGGEKHWPYQSEYLDLDCDLICRLDPDAVARLFPILALPRTYFIPRLLFSIDYKRCGCSFWYRRTVDISHPSYINF